MFSLVSILLITWSELVQSTQLIDKNIFILAGQSNMAGRGGVIDDIWDGIVPLECQSSPYVLRLNARLNWEEAREPLHADIDVSKVCGVGPGMAFANGVREIDPRIGVVGLVPCAVGGTNISEWKRGRGLYNELVRRGEVAMNEGGRLRGILWYQGESDTISKVDAEAYKVHLEKFIVALRSDLQAPMLPVIQVALASGQGPFVETVREAQLGLQLPNVRCVDAKGLQLEPDGLHLTTQSQVRLGQMVAQEFIKTLQRPMAIMSNSVSSITPQQHWFQRVCMISLGVILITCALSSEF